MDEIDRIVDEWNRVRPDLDVSPTHTLQRITRAGLLQGASFARVFAPYGISFGEYLVLAALRRAGPPYQMNPTRLFNSVILSSGAMTNRLDRLEEMDLVERLPDPSDRRGRLVALTDKGRELVDAAVVDHLANEEHLLAGLDPQERLQLAGLLRKLLLSEPFRRLDPAVGQDAPRPARATRTRRGR
jgi:DNA-binding MarR family transcriptional regulator